MASTLHTLGSLSQNTDDMQVTLEQLKQFRQQLYSSLAYGGDTIMDLLDALSSNTTALFQLMFLLLIFLGNASAEEENCQLL